MCIAIYPITIEQQVALSFAHERILQKRDGSFEISMDILIRNNGPTSISRLRLIIPSSLVDVENIGRIQDDSVVEKRITKLQNQQKLRLHIRTAELNRAENASNWFYNSAMVGHLEIDRTANDGVFSLKRVCPRTSSSMEPAVGYLKSGWEIDFPEDKGIDRHAWLLLAICDLAVFDIVNRGNIKESLHPNESMWVRLKLMIAPLGYNKKSWCERTFNSVVDYRLEFRSPGLVLSSGRRALEQFFHIDRTWGEPLGDLVIDSKRQVLELLPADTKRVEVKDWRTFLYCEVGLESELQMITPVHHSETKCRLPMVDAFGSGRAKQWWKRIWRSRSAGRRRYDVATELFFGTDIFGSQTHPDRYSVWTTSRCRNGLYSMLAWLAAILSILATVISIIALRL